MSAIRATALGSCLGLATFFGLATAIALEEEVDHAGQEHRVVRITSGRLHPEVVRLTTEEALAWVNYSSLIARISFEKSVAAKMKCRNRESFRITGERLESGRIQATQFASLCSLAPGKYAYRVGLFEGAPSGTSARGHEGTIIVQ